MTDKIQESTHSKASRSSAEGSAKVAKRKSSFFQRMAGSFRKSSGERGAGVEALRGARGADFEGYATVDRGVVDAGCFCFGQGSSVNDEKLLLVKGPFCFVFANESDKAPQYAISLAHMKCVKKAPKGGHFIVTLETNLGDVEYEMSFEKEDIATEFQEAVKKQAAVGQANEVKKRLGHEHLLTKRSSMRYAESIAMKKLADAPDKTDDTDVPYPDPSANIGGIGVGPGI